MDIDTPFSDSAGTGAGDHIGIGAELVVEVGPPANNGTCVARVDGRVVFVRGALPEEKVVARITEIGKKGRFFSGEVSTVLHAHPERVTPPCAYAGECGGCDYQHASVHLQRSMKEHIVVEALQRLGGVRDIGGVPLTDAVRCIDLGGEEPPGSGLGTRTRIRYAVDADGRLSMRKRGSHELVRVDACPLGTAAITSAASEFRDGQPGLDIEFIEGDDGMVVVRTAEDDYEQSVHREIDGLSWQMDASGFWQIHRHAASMLARLVSTMLEVSAGEKVLDLYAGAGLFAGALARLVGTRGAVTAVEANGQSVRDGQVALDHLGNVTFHRRQVLQWLRENASAKAPYRPDAVVCDPPRAGLGADVALGIASLRPRAIAYVSCDPATLARDIATFRERGYVLRQLRVLDMFPMTSHIECVALLEPTTTR